MIGRHRDFTASARRLAQTFVIERDLTPPVDVEALVKEVADLRHKVFPSGTGLDAVMWGLDTHARPTLLVNSVAPSTRKLFTLGHELGHVSMAWHVGTFSCNTSVEETADESTGPTLHGQESEADTFASEILVPRRFVAGLDHDNPASMLDDLLLAGVSPEAGILSLTRHLPAGYVFVLLHPGSNRVYRTYTSPGSFNIRVARDETLDTDKFSKYQSEAGLTTHRGRRVHWGKLLDASDVSADHDNWEDVLLDILSRTHPGESRSGKVWSSACGVAANANSSFGHEGLTVLVTRMRQRFLNRVDLHQLTEDARFDEFASARAIAFTTRPAARKKSKPN